MKTSQSGLLALIFFEGEVLHAYRDSVGVWTLGVGHTAAAGPPIPVEGMTITHQQALDLLAKDIQKYEAIVDKRLGATTVPQHVYDGMVSLCYNVEAAIITGSWVTSYLKGNMVAAEAQLKQWDRAGGVVLAGLARRRAEEADMIFRDKYPNGIPSPTTVTLPPEASGTPSVSPATVVPSTAVKPDPTSQQQSHSSLLDWLKQLVEEMFPNLAAWIGKL